MATTYTLIDKTILGSNQASVSFTGLGAYSSDYTDLVIKLSVRCQRAVNFTPLWVRLNSDTSNVYSMKLLLGDGTNPDTLSYTLGYYICGYINGTSSTSSTFTNGEIYIPNFSSSNYKSLSSDLVAENNATAGTVTLSAGLWSDGSAITSITFSEGNGGTDISSGSSFYLYGVKKN